MANPVVHFEIGCADSPKTQEFYTSLFGWKIDDHGPAAMVNTGADSGIHGHISTSGREPHQYVTVYVQVDDLQAYLNKAEQLGGKTVIPPTEIPEAGSFAWFADVEGNTIGLWKPVG